MYRNIEWNTVYSAEIRNTIMSLTCVHKSKGSEIKYVSLCLVWFGVIFIRHGLYQDGVFKFTVYIPDNYPDGECPVSSLILTCDFGLLTQNKHFL